MAKSLTRGQLARRAGVGNETLRFYERNGLIHQPPRSESGYRLYPESAIVRLRFIRRAKELGFSLREIKELFAIRVDPETTRAQVREEARAKIKDIKAKIRDLNKMKIALDKLTAACCADGPASECPILEALEGEKEDWLDGST